MIALVLLLGAVGMVVAPTPRVPAAASSTAVAWPEVTAFNPDVFEYVVRADFDFEGHLRMTPRGREAPFVDLMPGVPTTVPVSDFGRNETIDFVVRKCLLDACGPVVDERSVYVASYLGGLPTSLEGGNGLGPVKNIFPRLSPPAPTDVDWRATAIGDPETTVASGELRQVSAPASLGAVPDLEHGQEYHFTFDFHLHGPEWGSLRRTIERDVTWDSQIREFDFEMGRLDNLPRRTPVEVPGDTLYPRPDGLGDKLFATASFATGGSAEDAGNLSSTLEIWTPSGERVTRGRDLRRSRSGFHWTWDGEVARNDPAPPGNYRVRLVVADEAGNTRQDEWDLVVSDAVLTPRTRTYRVRPRPSMMEKDVGRCARLLTPARRGWAGSLGYRSAPECRDRDESAVVTTHGVWVHENLLDWGGARFRVRFSGAPVGDRRVLTTWSVKAPERRYRVFRSKRTGSTLVSPVTWALEDFLWDERDGKRLIPVTFGTDEGHAYDLRHIEIEVSYRVLEGE